LQVWRGFFSQFKAMQAFAVALELFAYGLCKMLPQKLVWLGWLARAAGEIV
jgi:hypothetical protein